MTRILIRADATPRMGSGHVMRCLALSQALRVSGLEPLLAGHVEIPWVRERLRRETIDHEFLPGPPPEREDPEALTGLVAKVNPSAVVLDGYHFGLDCQKTIRAAGCCLLVIDDYRHLPEYSADILLNQNLGVEELGYRGDIGLKLIGPEYALLRPEFAAARPAAERRILSERAEHLLLTLGGGDFSDHLKNLAQVFNHPELAGRTLNVLAGKMPPEKIKAALTGSPARLSILSGVDDMPGLLLATDLAVSAAGSTSWELCCLGVPFMTVEVAENQKPIAAALADRGLAPHFSEAALKKLLTSQGERRQAGAKGLKLVDGLGAFKVLQNLRKGMG